MARGAILCNDAALRERDGQWMVRGDPMEGALLVFGVKAGLDIEAERKTSPRTDEIPFDAEHRFMATLHHEAIHALARLVKEVLLDLETLEVGAAAFDGQDKVFDDCRVLVRNGLKHANVIARDDHADVPPRMLHKRGDVDHAVLDVFPNVFPDRYCHCLAGCAHV
jgi:magnesium-transporting ATPase (P-type)